MNPLVPIVVVLCLPLAAIGLLLATDTGIEPRLFYHSVITFAGLGAVAVAISFGASKLAERAKH